MLKTPWRHAARLAAIALTLGALGCGRPEAPLPAVQAPIAQAAAFSAEDGDPGFKAPKEDLGHFFQVDEGLYRGQQPTDAGVKKLSELGVKTIVYLHHDKKQAAHEQQLAESLGMRFVHIPMSAITVPSPAKIDQWLKVATDPAARPVFIHCQHGRDRTGALVGTYRIQHDGWSFDQAYAEMKQRGFRTFFLGLTYAVKRHANVHFGLVPSPEPVPAQAAAR